MYKEVIDRISLVLTEEGTRKKREYLYASDVFQCKRRIYFEFLGQDMKKEDLSPEQCRIFQNGHDVHDRMSRYLKKAGIDFDVEVNVPIDPELNVHGRMDALVYENTTLDSKKPKDILEFKSINLPIVKAPKIEHAAQLTYYLHQMKMQKGFLIYESKANQRIFEFPIDYDPDFAQEIIEYYKDVWSHIKRVELPPIMYERYKYPCKIGSFKCRFFDNCWGQGIKAESVGIKRFVPYKE